MAAVTAGMWQPAEAGVQLDWDQGMRLLAAVQQQQEHQQEAEQQAGHLQHELHSQQQQLSGEGNTDRQSQDSGLPGVAVVDTRYSHGVPGGVPSYVPTVIETPEVKGGDGAVLCQVEGCCKDIREEKEYYQRYRICEEHLKLGSLMKDGKPQRFCQQCGRFHELAAFDGDKRSCRARLQLHNNRRRKRSKQPAASRAAAAAADGSDSDQDWDVTMEGSPTARGRRPRNRKRSSPPRTAARSSAFQAGLLGHTASAPDLRDVTRRGLDATAAGGIAPGRGGTAAVVTGDASGLPSEFAAFLAQQRRLAGLDHAPLAQAPGDPPSQAEANAFKSASDNFFAAGGTLVPEQNWGFASQEATLSGQAAQDVDWLRAQHLQQLSHGGLAGPGSRRLAPTLQRASAPAAEYRLQPLGSGEHHLAALMNPFSGQGLPPEEALHRQQLAQAHQPAPLPDEEEFRRHTADAAQASAMAAAMQSPDYFQRMWPPAWGSDPLSQPPLEHGSFLQRHASAEPFQRLSAGQPFNRISSLEQPVRRLASAHLPSQHDPHFAAGFPGMQAAAYAAQQMQQQQDLYDAQPVRGRMFNNFGTLSMPAGFTGYGDVPGSLAHRTPSGSYPPPGHAPPGQAGPLGFSSMSPLSPTHGRSSFEGPVSPRSGLRRPSVPPLGASPLGSRQGSYSIHQTGSVDLAAAAAAHAAAVTTGASSGLAGRTGGYGRRASAEYPPRPNPFAAPVESGSSRRSSDGAALPVAGFAAMRDAWPAVRNAASAAQASPPLAQTPFNTAGDPNDGPGGQGSAQNPAASVSAAGQQHMSPVPSAGGAWGAGGGGGWQHEGAGRMRDTFDSSPDSMPSAPLGTSPFPIDAQQPSPVPGATVTTGGGSGTGSGTHGTPAEPTGNPGMQAGDASRSPEFAQRLRQLSLQYYNIEPSSLPPELQEGLLEVLQVEVADEQRMPAGGGPLDAGRQLSGI